MTGRWWATAVLQLFLRVFSSEKSYISSTAGLPLVGRVAVLKGTAQCQKVTFRSGLELMRLVRGMPFPYQRDELRANQGNHIRFPVQRRE